MTSRTDRNSLLLIAALAAVWLAMLLLGGPGSPLDQAILEAARRPELVPASLVLSTLGGWIFLLPACLLAALVLAVRGARRRGLLLILLIAAGRLLVELQKFWFDRVRPDPEGHLVAIHNMAFPSGHAANSMIALLGFALIAFGATRARRPAILIALLLAGIVGLSRLVLAVHWPSDVVGGWAFGAAFTLVLLRIAGALGESGTERLPASFIDPGKERTMNDSKDRPDDSALIDEMEDATAQGGTAGGNLQRDVASQAEEEHEVGGATGVTRVTGEDKPADGAEPRLPNRD